MTGTRALAMAALCCGAMLASSPAVAQAAGPGAGPKAGLGVGPDCTLNVWGGGRPNYTPKYSKRVAAAIARSNTPEMLDPANPLSNISLFNTVNRARALPDATLRALMPDARSVTIVRHDTMIDFDATPLDGIRAPIASAATGCTADLVVAGAYAIFPNPNAPYATSLLGFAVGSALAGGDRLIVDFWYQRFADGMRSVAVRKKDDRPLPHLRFATPELAQAMTISADANLAGFAAMVAAKQAK